MSDTEKTYDGDDAKNYKNQSFESLKYVFNMQNERIKEIGNKANNSLLLATILIGVGFTIYSIDSDKGNAYNKIIMLLTFIVLLSSLTSSFVVMYLIALRPIPFINTDKVYMCLNRSDLDQNCLIGNLIVLKEMNEKYFPYYQKLSLVSYALMLVGMIFEVYYAVLVVI
ncbi:hypothetical protein HWN40_13260 [Methanolobus zinderi]|uniref:Uncharacterized protein n=1 Tax=Methanolobus zinderi TaxID=536044 RepID=A0A7D5E9B0_9EURY|nr:hypothetical protein [Methanolobus zinderi]QLC51118.1 hypothetical protein HWN40_13260 [Methanolobus zinderi]